MPQLVRVGRGMSPEPSGGAAVGAFSLVEISDDAITTGRPQPLKDGNSIFSPFVDSTGRHWLFEIDGATKAVLGSLQLSTAHIGIQDDHLGSIGLCITPGGGKLVVYAGHNTDNLLRFRYSADGTLAGFGSEYTVDVGAVTVYPQLYVLPSGKIICWFRDATDYWSAITTNGEGSAAGNWSARRRVITSPNQMYANLNINGDNTTIGLAGDQPNLGNSKPYIFEVDWSTGAVSSLSGIVSNFLTSSPKAVASAPSDCALFFDPGTESAGIGDWDQFGGVVLGVREANSQFSKRYYMTPPADPADRFDRTEWTQTEIFAGVGHGGSGYGVGDLHDPPYSYQGELASLETPGLENPTILSSRMFRNEWSLDAIRSDAADGTGPWKKVMHYHSMLRGSSDLMGRPVTVANSPDFGFYESTPFREYDGANWDSRLLMPRIDTVAGRAPILDVETDWNWPEYSTFALQLATVGAEPFGAEVTGGADKLKFFIHRNILYFDPKSYATPQDANTDNVYTCEVTLTGNGGHQVTHTFNITITSALASRTNRLTKTHAFNDDAAWNKVGVDVPSSIQTDPFGGSQACRIRQDTTNVNHNINQSKTLTASTEQTISVWAKADGARFLGIAGGTGAGNPGFKAIFDLIKGDYVSRGSASPALELTDYGVYHDPAWGADWWLCWITAATQSTSAAQVAFSVQAYSSPGSIEVGLTTNRILLYGAQLANGTIGNYQDVA